MARFASPDDRRHDPRTALLAASLGLNRFEVLGRLDWLYAWAATYAPDGDLAAFSDDQISDACAWTGDPARLVVALLDAGVLTPDATIAEWDERFGRELKRRAYKARHERARRARARGVHVDARVDTHVDTHVDARVDTTAPSAPRPPSPPSPPTPSLPDSPGAPPTGAAPTPPSGASGPAGDTGSGTPGEISGPGPGARAREARPVAKPTPTQVRLARIVDLVTAAGLEIYPSSRDGAALKSCGAPADRIAEAYVAAARGEWDPGGDGWLGDSLSVHLVISRLAGYRPKRGGDYRETRYGRLPERDPLEGAVAF